MNFDKNDLLNFEEINTMITSDFPNERAKIIASKLINYCFIYNDGNIYALQSNITYIKTDKIEDKLITHTTLLIEESYKALSKENIELIMLRHKTIYRNIFKNSEVSKYLPQLRTKLIVDNVIFDKYLDIIHFNNGYYNLETQEFKPRIKHIHYITEYIKHDYVPSTQSQRNALLLHVKKIYPNNDDLECMLKELGWTLSGRSYVDQSTLFLLGDGSSGKSFILQLTQGAVECYLMELKSDTFSFGNPKLDKILNQYAKTPHVRLSWVNEMKDVKIAEDIFKDFCEGSLKTTKLYEDGMSNFNHYSKCIVTANVMPSIKIDTGVTRKFLGYTHKSHFTEVPKEVNEKQHVYLKDKKLLGKLKDQNLMCAWFDILADNCLKIYKNNNREYTQNFIETKTTVMDSNDFVKDFIDECLEVTNNADDRIGKNSMHKLFMAVYPNKHLSVLQLITSLKEKKIIYNTKFRCDNVQGCFTGVRIRKSDNIRGAFNNDDEEDYNNGIDKTPQNIEYVAKSDYDKLVGELMYYRLKEINNMEAERITKQKKRLELAEKVLSMNIKPVVEQEQEEEISFNEIMEIFNL